MPSSLAKAETIPDCTKPSFRKITVAHLMPSSVIGGAETATLRMTAATASQFRHVAVCPPEAVALRQLFEQQGTETLAYAAPTPSLRHFVRFYKESLTIAHTIQAVGADIVHFADKFAAYRGSLAAVLARTRLVCHIRLSHPHLTWRDRLSLWPVDSFIFVSKDARKTFHLSLPDKKARVIYDAIEVSDADMTESTVAVRRELGVPAGSILVGMVARVAPQKDFFTLAAAAAQVLRKHPDTRFLVVGEHSVVESHRNHYEQVLRRLNELGIADRFIFTGHRDDVPRLIAAMDIAVLCTHREGFGLVVAESMAYRKPVIATAVGGVLDIIQPGVNGYLHQHGDSEELARAIVSLIEHPDHRKRIGDAGYEHVRNSYSRQIFVEDITKAYSDVMRN